MSYQGDGFPSVFESMMLPSGSYEAAESIRQRPRQSYSSRPIAFRLPFGHVSLLQVNMVPRAVRAMVPNEK